MNGDSAPKDAPARLSGHRSKREGDAAPQVATVSIATLRELRRIADPHLAEADRKALCSKLAPELDHLILVAKERSWSL